MWLYCSGADKPSELARDQALRNIALYAYKDVSRASPCMSHVLATEQGVFEG